MTTTMTRLIACCSAILLFLPPAAPAAPPVSDSAAAGADDPFGGKVWELTSYLKGTAPEIRERLNGEVERLMAKVAEAQQGIRESRADAHGEEQGCLEKLHKSPAYQSAAADAKRAEADLAAARQGGSSTDRLAASSRFTKARAALERMDKDALEHCDAVRADLNRARDLERELKRYREALDKASKWRGELLTAMRNGFCMKAPVRVGSKGTLPTVLVLKVEAPDRALVLYAAPELVDRGKDEEGLKTYTAIMHKTKIRLVGIDANSLKEDDTPTFDLVFIIDGKDPEDLSILTARREPADPDKLFGMVVPLRKPTGAP